MKKLRVTRVTERDGEDAHLTTRVCRPAERQTTNSFFVMCLRVHTA